MKVVISQRQFCVTQPIAVATRMPMSAFEPILRPWTRRDTIRSNAGAEPPSTLSSLFKRDSWERLAALRKRCRIQSLDALRGRTFGAGSTSDDVVRRFAVVRRKRHRYNPIFDALNDTRNLVAIEETIKCGAHHPARFRHHKPCPYACRRPCQGNGGNGRQIHMHSDMAGVMSSKEAYDLVSAI